MIRRPPRSTLFPTRRSSDLSELPGGYSTVIIRPSLPGRFVRSFDRSCVTLASCATSVPDMRLRRSEEHTSELQSRQYLVCRLLLEKKKSKQHNTKYHQISQH